MSEEKDVKAVLKYLIAPDADCHLDKKQLVQLLHDWDTLRARANNPRILPLRQFAIARSVFLVVCIVTSYNKNVAQMLSSSKLVQCRIYDSPATRDEHIPCWRTLPVGSVAVHKPRVCLHLERCRS